MSRIVAAALVATVAALSSCTEDTPGYCKDNDQCQDKSWEHYEPGKPRCHPVTHRCVSLPSDGGVDAGPDGPEPDGDTRKELGDECSDGGECQSGYCVDKVCCNVDACSGICTACDVEGFKGQCEKVPSGEPHDDDCKGSVSGGLCDGVCDGAGACTYPGAEKEGCAPKTCAAGEETIHICDGNGGCTTKKQLCNGFVCDGDSCKTSCTTGADCLTDFNCSGGKCVADLPNGKACGTNDDACKSKQCVDGVCCEKKPCGTCQTCNGTAPGTCTNIPSGGAAPAGQCPGDASCGAGICDGLGKCAYKAVGFACAADKCDPATDKLTKSACDASHVCKAGAATACPEFVQCQSGQACKVGCVDHANDCIAGSFCDRSAAHASGKGKCVDPATVETLAVGDDIGAKLASAPAGKTVFVVPAGTYKAAINISKDVTIIGTGTETSPSKIDPDSDGVALTVQAGKTVGLQGLLIQGATGTAGVGVNCSGSIGNKATLTIVESTIIDNKSIGVAASYCDVTLRRNKIQNNQGGGVKLSDGTFTVVNTLVTGNGVFGSAGSAIGGMNLSPGSGALTLVNNTVAENLAKTTATGSGMICSTTTPLHNNIVWGNQGGTTQISGCTFSYSDVEGSAGGTGNISVNPSFDTSYKPQAAACFNSGNSAAPELGKLDLANGPRVKGTKVDMGAYEVQ